MVKKYDDYACCKRIESETVFLPGWEEGLFPIKNQFKKKDKWFRGRRRLAYVGITRQKNAIISFSMNRFYQGDY